MLFVILIVLLVLALGGSFPAWPHAAGWGYGPFGGIGILLIVLVLFMVFRGRV
jgi:hypothetical protein